MPITAELKPLPGFASLETWHCVTGSMRHLYVFHGQPFSEDLLLGLGAGVGFIYWHMKGLPPMIGGRGNVGAPGEEGLEKTAGRRTGVSVEVFRTTSTRKAERTLLEMLESGEPVMVQLDMGFLPYFDLPDDFHFGGHVAVVAGYDPTTRTVLMADRDHDLHPVSLDTLALARGSTFKPFPPSNQWYTFDFTAARAPQPAEVRTAISEVVERMLCPPISNAGVKGIRKTAQRVRTWPQQMTVEELGEACFNAFIFIDATGGTGGGLFRYMYARFLEEASTITADPRIGQAGNQLHHAGDQWQTVAELFQRAAADDEPGRYLEAVSERLVEIAGLEEQVWASLTAVGTG